MRNRGLFITFEGPEGSGKSTHSKLLYDFLKQKGYKVVYTREPGGTKIGERLRKVLLDPKNKEIDAVSEMLLYMAARAQIIKEKILPALEDKNIVICDRFMDATLAYQGYGGNCDIETIKKIGSIVTKNTSPDLTFLLDIDIKEGLFRSGKNKDRIERKSILYHKRVREGYLTIARNQPHRVKVLSAVGDISKTQKDIRNVVLKLCHSQI